MIVLSLYILDVISGVTLLLFYYLNAYVKDIMCVVITMADNTEERRTHIRLTKFKIKNKRK